MKFGTKSATHDFGKTADVKNPRSSYDMSHNVKTTFDSGYLIPIFNKLAYPGDTFNIKANCFAKLSTPIVPIMDGLYLKTYWFAVPIRLIWDNFKKFMGEQNNPGDSVIFMIPQTTSPTDGFVVGSLYDYMGVPTVGQIGSGKTLSVNNLYPRAYNLIYNEWFRDENLQNSVVVDKDDGPDTYSDYVLLKKGKIKDYLTGCLPFLQKGTAVQLPLGNSAIVKGDITKHFQLEGFNTGAKGYAYLISTAGSAPVGWTVTSGSPANGEPFAGDPVDTGLYADLSTATSATINQFRQALQVQGLYERDARYGTRYTEVIFGHFGVVSSDARLQRPEYLGGNSTRLSITPVAQTSNTPASGTPQGNLAAYGLANTVPNGFVKSFEEHCLVLGLVSVCADLSYQQGIDRDWTDQTKLDLMWPLLCNVGEQAVLTKEIYCTGDPANDEVVFGYQERYGHLRYWKSQITGKMRSTASGTLDVYTLSQKFTSAPTLGDTFIKESPPISRVVAVNTEPQFIFDAFIDAQIARTMPTYGIPGLLSRM